MSEELLRPALPGPGPLRHGGEQGLETWYSGRAARIARAHGRQGMPRRRIGSQEAGVMGQEVAAHAVRQLVHRHPLNFLPAQPSNDQVGSIMSLPPRLIRATNV